MRFAFVVMVGLMGTAAFAQSQSPATMSSGTLANGPAQSGEEFAGLFGPKTSLSTELIREQNRIASQFVAPDKSCEGSADTPEGRAARATVQIISKSAVFPNPDGTFSIFTEKSPFCAGHPLERAGGAPTFAPRDPLDKSPLRASLAGQVPVTVKPCSGFLVDDGNPESSVIGTAAHCLWDQQGKGDVEKFCKDNVIVFSRGCGKTRFTKDEVFNCTGGKAVEERVQTKDFNLHSQTKARDHAFLRLERAVPATTAVGLKVRATDETSRPGAKGEKRSRHSAILAPIREHARR